MMEYLPHRWMRKKKRKKERKKEMEREREREREREKEIMREERECAYVFLNSLSHYFPKAFPR